MSTAWIVAFAVLAGAVAFLTVTVLGLMRRMIPILEQLEAKTPDGPDFGARAGTVIDPFELYTRAGDRVEWRDFVTGPTVMLLVASNCAPCRDLPSKLADVGEDVDGVPLLVVADDAADDMTFELERRWRVLYDVNATAAQALRNQATPQAYFIDPSGLVLARTIPNSRNDLTAIVNTRTRERRLTAIS